MNGAGRYNRKLGLISAGMVKFRFKVDDYRLMGEVQDEAEEWMVESAYLEDAPFEWITLSLRFGLKDDEQPLYFRISKKYRDLPMSIELDVRDLRFADEEQVKRAFLVATLKSLVHAGKKYELNTERISTVLASLLVVPSSQST